MVQSHEELLRKYGPGKDRGQGDVQMGEVQSRIREITPTLVNQANKDIYQHLFNYKLEIKTLRDDVLNLADNFKTSFSNAQTDVSNSNKNNNSTL